MQYGIEVPRWEVFVSINHLRKGKSRALSTSELILPRTFLPCVGSK